MLSVFFFQTCAQIFLIPMYSSVDEVYFSSPNISSPLSLLPSLLPSSARFLPESILCASMTQYASSWARFLFNGRRGSEFRFFHGQGFCWYEEQQWLVDVLYTPSKVRTVRVFCECFSLAYTCGGYPKIGIFPNYLF